MTLSLGTVALLLLVGLVIGIIGGMLGIGGGVLVIPALVAIFGLPHEKAVGTSLAMLLPPIGVFAFLQYHRSGNAHVPMAIVLACGFAVGAYLGGRWVNSGAVPLDKLRLLFAFFLLYIAGNIIFARTDPTVRATVKTAALVLITAASYLALRAVGRRAEKRFAPRETFVSHLRQPLRPDYEI